MVFSVLILAALAASTVSLPAVAVQSPPVTWGPPQLAVPTTTNSGGSAQVTSVSCSSDGNCVAGGFYRDGAGFQAFVVSQTAGVWGNPRLAVPTTTNSGNEATVSSVSCSSVGNCAAGGYYTDGAGLQAFVVSQTAGLWGTPRLAVPTTTNSGNNAQVTSVSCSSTGTCVAGGYYREGAGFFQAFVVSQTAGVWGTHQLVVPTTTNSGNSAEVRSVSCSSAGNCAAGGFYTDGAGRQAFVVSQTAGVWGTPQLAVPTTTNSGNTARVNSVSCSSAGNCAAGGSYSDGAGEQAFVVSQTVGVWGTPQLAVLTTTNSGGFASVNSVSCSSAGNCAAGGSYRDGAGEQAFVVSQTAGLWGTHQLVVPTTTNSGRFASVTSVSCWSAGTCAAGGFYRVVTGSSQAFVVSQTAGVWETHQLAVPATTNSGNNARVRSVSCSSAGNCVAGGSYRDGAGTQAFVVNEDPAAFADVGRMNPFYTFVQWMASAGISAGTAQPSGKPLYKPADAVSRQAMALFMFRLSDDTETFIPPATPTFADVTLASHPQFYTAIEWMAARDISEGTAQPPGKPLFKPSDPVSRQAMALFVARYAGATLTTPPTTQRFADVPLNAGTAAAIDWMFVTGVSTGTTQPSGLPLYRPTIPVSRQAMAAFLFRVDNLP